MHLQLSITGREGEVHEFVLLLFANNPRAIHSRSASSKMPYSQPTSGKRGKTIMIVDHALPPSTPGHMIRDWSSNRLALHKPLNTDPPGHVSILERAIFGYFWQPTGLETGGQSCIRLN